MTEKEIICKCCHHKVLAKLHSDGKIYVWCKECRKEVELELDLSFPNSKSITIPKIKLEVEPYEPTGRTQKTEERT